MRAEAAPELLAAAAAEIAARVGLAFPVDDAPRLAARLDEAAPALGLGDAAGVAAAISGRRLAPREWALLAERLTIGETYFLREPSRLAALVGDVVPELLAAAGAEGRPLRAWSAGCSTGEEPYSLAILLRRAFPGLAPGRLELLATDLNEASLERARRGVYTEWAFRDAPQWLRDGYFGGHAQGLAIDPGVRAMVRFERHNLVEDPFPGGDGRGLDLVLCRNVLMYFAPDIARRVVARLVGALRPGGYLVVSINESGSDLFRELELVVRSGAHLHRRAAGEAPRSPARTAPPRVVRHAVPARPTVPASAPPAAPAPPPAPPPGEGLLERARSLADRGHLTEALEACREALTADPLDARAHYVRALVLQELADPRAAVRALQRTIYLDPELVPAYVALAALHRALDNLPESRRQLANARALLARLAPGDVVPESNGTTAGVLVAMLSAEPRAVPGTEVRR